MRHGIRDLLLVMSVVCGGLAIGAPFVAADDQPPTSATASPKADPPADDPAETPAPEAAAPEAAAPEAATPEAAEAEPAEAVPEDAGKKPSGDDGSATESEPDAPPADDGAKGEGAKGEGGEGEGGEGEGEGGSEDHSLQKEDHEAAHDDHAADHDPHDLSHVNATDAIEDPSEIRSDLAIWTLVVFLCLLALLAKFAWGPIMEGLERREASIAASIDEAEHAAAKGVEQLKLYEAKLAAAADETREILAQARKDAEATGERIVSEAQEAAARERDKAVADISAAKNSALQEITERSVDLAVSMAGRMIQRQLTPDDRAGLIRETLDQLPNQN